MTMQQGVNEVIHAMASHNAFLRWEGVPYHGAVVVGHWMK